MVVIRVSHRAEEHRKVQDAWEKICRYFELNPSGQSGISTGTQWLSPSGEELPSESPITGEILGVIRQPNVDQVEQVIQTAKKTFEEFWRMVPAPRRGELVRRIGEEVRKHKDLLGTLITLEMGKILEEGKGEVQEWIDMCDFATGLSRQLYGLTMASERPRHRLYEQWHPLGVVGIITAFNFPVAVWSWNAMIALVCGDTTVWKPSSLTPFCAVVVQKIAGKVLKELDLPEGIINLVAGSSRSLGNVLVDSRDVPLISFTGSVEGGRKVYERVARRLGRVILELGGNNALILTPSANLSLAIRAITFAAIGTAGQRCTTLRRLIIHESLYDRFVQRLRHVYSQIRVGNPLDPDVHMGPVVGAEAVQTFLNAQARLLEEGGEILHGGNVLENMPSPYYVEPALAYAPSLCPITCEETFAPLLYLLKYRDIREAIALNNGVPQGLSSAIFTTDLREAELFLSAEGSDCGIANVNTATSGAEIGGAFGGEKDTGGGREAGSDAWKAYMRRQTVTINWADDLPLAQGIQFEVEKEGKEDEDASHS